MTLNRKCRPFAPTPRAKFKKFGLRESFLVAFSPHMGDKEPGQFWAQSYVLCSVSLDLRSRRS